MNILEELAVIARERVAADQRQISETEMHALADRAGPGGGARFLQAIRKPGLSLICEIKKASPSKGVISPDFPYLSIARSYESGGADCVSCLTEPRYFLGSDQIFREIRSEISLPMLRKDFTVDAYQLDQARIMGADAALLIVSLLDDRTLALFLRRCEELDIAALVETHDGEEIDRAVAAGAVLIGVNNRNLKDFSVDFENAARLRDRIPPSCLYVAESGVRTPEDVELLRRIGADAALVGESLMRAEDPVELLRAFRGRPEGADAALVGESLMRAEDPAELLRDFRGRPEDRDTGAGKHPRVSDVPRDGIPDGGSTGRAVPCPPGEPPQRKEAQA